MALPDKTILVGLSWSTLPDVMKLSLLAEFGSQGESVGSMTDEQRAWFADTFLDITGRETEIDAINNARGYQPRVPYRVSLAGESVCKADLLLDPFTYADYYPVLHECPLVLVAEFWRPD